MESIRQFWSDVMAIPAARWVIAVFGLVTCILIAIYVLKWIREMAVGGGTDSVNPISHLAEFERLHAEGKLNADEYQRLKKALPQNVLPQSLLPKKVMPESKAETKQTRLPASHSEAPDFIETKDND